MERHNKWGLMNSLVNIINTYDEESLESVIARYFLSHFNTLDELNVYDAADDCFTSRAGIRRFCQMLGYDNFKDLKAEAIAYYDESKHYYDLQDEVNLERNAEQLYQMAKECNKALLMKKDHLLDILRKADTVVFLVSDVYLRSVVEFQKSMILSGKMIRVVSQKFDESQLLDQLNENDAVFVISISGFFEGEIRSVIHEKKCHKILVTSLRKEEYNSEYDEIVYVSDSEVTQTRTVYHAYAIEYILDLLSDLYRS